MHACTAVECMVKLACVASLYKVLRYTVCEPHCQRSVPCFADGYVPWEGSFICMYVYTYVGAAFHGIFCFIIQDSPHDAYTSADYTHAHACIDETACIAHSPLHCIALLFTCSCYTTDCLLAFVRSSLTRMHIYIHTCKPQHQFSLKTWSPS